jgi:hypothetical protein
MPAHPIAPGPPSYAQAVAAQPAFEPGQRFQYGPTPFQVFGEIIRRKLAAADANPDPLDYLSQRVLDPATGIVAALMGAGTGWQDAAFLQALLG